MNLVPEYNKEDLSKTCTQRGRKSKPTVSIAQSEGEPISGTGSTTALQYTFDETVAVSTFKGSQFYLQRKNFLFLTELEVVEGILCQGKKIRQQLKTLQPGQYLKIGNAMLRQGVPLQIRKGDPDVEILDHEFTLNRLTGLCATYSAQESPEFTPKRAMGIALGIHVTKDSTILLSCTWVRTFHGGLYVESSFMRIEAAGKSESY